MARLSKKNEELLKAVQRQAARQQQSADNSPTKTAAEVPNNASVTSLEQIPVSEASTSTSVTNTDPAQASETQAPRAQNPSAVGLGVDLVEIDRMEKVIKRTPRVVERVFTSGEREYAWSKARPAIHYAAFFAAREAVVKALGCGFAGLDYADVEITHDEKGKPEVVLHNNAKAIAEQQGIVEIQISLSHTHQMAVASAVAIKEFSSPPLNENLDPMEELARKFKELRSLLDDIGASDIISKSESDALDTDEQSAATEQQDANVFARNE